jgi:hypothetical protein
MFKMPLQGSTQWDAFAHVMHHDTMYNGYWAGNVTAFGGAAVLGIEHHRTSFVGRGVLLDVARAEGVDVLAANTAVDRAMLARCVEHHGVELRPGDMILVRTSYLSLWDPTWSPAEGAEYFFGSGLGKTTVEWCHEHDVSAVATDTIAVEVFQPEAPTIAAIRCTRVNTPTGLGRRAHGLELIGVGDQVDEHVRERLVGGLATGDEQQRDECLDLGVAHLLAVDRCRAERAQQVGTGIGTTPGDDRQHVGLELVLRVQPGCGDVGVAAEVAEEGHDRVVPGLEAVVVGLVEAEHVDDDVDRELDRELPDEVDLAVVAPRVDERSRALAAMTGTNFSVSSLPRKAGWMRLRWTECSRPSICRIVCPCTGLSFHE